MYTLRPYQQQAVDATLAHFRKSNAAAVIVLPTGAGKSLVIAELARLARKKILVVTHVKELVAQNCEKFKEYADPNGIKTGIYSAGLKQKQTDNQVTFASIQSVVRNISDFANQYSLIIIDECHRVNDFSGDSQYGQLVTQLQQLNTELKILGLTATPYRMGMGWIYQYHYHGIKRDTPSPPFEKCIYELPITYMIKHQFLTPPKLIDATVEQYDFSVLSASKNGTYNENEVNQLLLKYPRVTQAIIEQVVDISNDRQGIMIFAATVKHAEEVMRYLPHQQSALITGATENKIRDQLISKFKQKKIKYLVNVSVLTTGFDAPHVDVIAILRPTESVSLYQQIVGRGLRLAEHKKDCLVIDYAGNGINIFYPEIGSPKPDSNSELVQVFCPSCGFANSFWGKKDQQGNLLEHFGRKCQGAFEDDSGKIEDCDYRFRFKECEHCQAENDIAARQCHQCHQAIVDPDDKLKAALKLKNAMVVRCQAMTMEPHKTKDNCLVIHYYDEDGFKLTEQFDFNSTKQQYIFNRDFGRRFKQGVERIQFTSSEQVNKLQANFTHPDFIVARKQKHYYQIQQKIFDYQGQFRKANQLN